MATTHYRCEHCSRVATVADFTRGEQHVCPGCGESDDVFPFRMFRCKECGFEGTQHEFFDSEMPADDDPVEEQWEEVHHEHPNESWSVCESTDYEQINVPAGMNVYRYPLHEKRTDLFDVDE